MEQYVVTISRQFGSLGRTIAQKLSEKLEVEFWDRDIVEAAAKRMGQPLSVVSDEEESVKNAFFIPKKFKLNLATYSMTDEIFEIEKNIIRDEAAKKSCIIVGRCADYILQDYKNHLSVYLYAPYEARLSNCINHLMMDEKTAKKMIHDVDLARTYYQRKYCPEVRDVFDHKDMMIDTSRFGVEGTAEIIAQIVNAKWGQP